MKIKNKKLNNKGFSHVEMLLLVVALVIVGGIGFYVYKKNTAHAGGNNYQYIGTASYTDGNTFSFAACKQSLANSGVTSGATSGVTSGVVAYNSQVNILVTANSGVTSGATSGVTSGVVASNYSAWLADFTTKKLILGPTLLNNVYAFNWTGNSTTLSMPYSTSNNNHFYASMQLAGKGGPWGTTGGFWFRPSNLAKC